MQRSEEPSPAEDCGISAEQKRIWKETASQPIPPNILSLRGAEARSWKFVMRSYEANMANRALLADTDADSFVP